MCEIGLRKPTSIYLILGNSVYICDFGDYISLMISPYKIGTNFEYFVFHLKGGQQWQISLSFF